MLTLILKSSEFWILKLLFVSCRYFSLLHIIRQLNKSKLFYILYNTTQTKLLGLCTLHVSSSSQIYECWYIQVNSVFKKLLWSWGSAVCFFNFTAKLTLTSDCKKTTIKRSNIHLLLPEQSSISIQIQLNHSMFEVMYLVCVCAFLCACVCVCVIIGPEYSACGGKWGSELMQRTAAAG